VTLTLDILRDVSAAIGLTRQVAESGMVEVIVGVALTAVLGGLLVPLVKGILDRRSERYSSSLALVDTLAASLWEYWKLALRVAYYGRQGPRGAEGLEIALGRWDSDDSWNMGSAIQIQLSRSRRLLPPAAHQELSQSQRNVVDYLDREIDRLRVSAEPDDWSKLYESLMIETRSAIDALLVRVTRQLKIGRIPYS
jgi:hypothetical protein